MHCHEHIRLSEIAACIVVTASLICQIHAQTVALPNNYLSFGCNRSTGFDFGAYAPFVGREVFDEKICNLFYFRISITVGNRP